MELTKLEQQVFTEPTLLNELGLTKKQLDYLRWKKGFPYVELQRNVRVYLTDEVFEYIERRAREQQFEKFKLRK